MALEIFKLVGSIFVDNEAANDSIAKTDKKAEGLGSTLIKGVGTAAKWGAGIVAAAGSAAVAVGGAAMSAAGAADEVDKMSQKIGLSKEGYQEWAYIMGQNGMEIDKMQTGVKTLVAQMDAAASGTKSAVENFEKLGVSIYDANGNLKDQETMMEEALYALAEMENGTEKARLATELFGKSGSEMMPMLNQGAQAMTDLKDRAHDLGLIMSDEAVNAGVVLGDTMDDVKKSFGMVVTQLGVSVMPIVQKFADMLLSHLPKIQEMMGVLFPIITGAMDLIMPCLMDLSEQILPVVFELMSTLLPVLMELASAILPIFTELIQLLLPPLLEIVQAVLPVLVTIIEALTPILQVLIDLLTPIIQLFVDLLGPIIKVIAEALNPLIEKVGLLISTALEPLSKVISAVAGVFGGALKGMFDDAKPIIDKIIGAFSGITTFLSGIFSGDFKKAFQGISDIVKNIFGGIVEIVKFPINSIIGLINGFIGGLNQIKIPDWVPAVGGKGINIPKIPMLYEGGDVADAGRVLVGEAGPEFLDLPKGARVTPLDKSLGNTSGLEELLRRIYERLETMSVTEIVRVVPDERGIFEIVREQGREYQDTTGNLVFD